MLLIDCNLREDVTKLNLVVLMQLHLKLEVIKILPTRKMAQTLPVTIALIKASNVQDDLVNEVS